MSFLVGDLEDCDANISGIGKGKETKRGTVFFTVTDDKDFVHKIHLSLALYLPSCARNIFSVSAWNREHNDSTTITSNGDFSIFQ